MRAWRTYPALAQATWAHTIVYCTVLVIALLNAAFPLVMMAIWVKLAHEAPIAGFGVGDFVSYYLAVVLVRQVTAASTTVDLERVIHSGELSTYPFAPAPHCPCALSARW